MRVNGVEIDDKVVGEAMKLIRQLPKGFEFYHVVRRCSQAGVPDGVADRAADRILQKLRKGGEIEFRGGLWFVTAIGKAVT